MNPYIQKAFNRDPNDEIVCVRSVDGVGVEVIRKRDLIYGGRYYEGYGKHGWTSLGVIVCVLMIYCLLMLVFYSYTIVGFE